MMARNILFQEKCSSCHRTYARLPHLGPAMQCFWPKMPTKETCRMSRPCIEGKSFRPLFTRWLQQAMSVNMAAGR